MAIGVGLTHQRHCTAASKSKPTGGTIKRSKSLLKARLEGPAGSKQSVDKLPLESAAKAKLVAEKTQRIHLGVGMLI